MDEARASCAIDISGRPYCHFVAELPPGGTGGFDHELAEEFFRAVANAARMTVHIDVETGTNAHHMIEAAFKAFAARCARRSRSTRARPACRRRRGTLTA
jgi:imidazoleglycerol-phosphate dehydratase